MVDLFESSRTDIFRVFIPANILLIRRANVVAGQEESPGRCPCGSRVQITSAFLGALHSSLSLADEASLAFMVDSCESTKVCLRSSGLFEGA